MYSALHEVAGHHQQALRAQDVAMATAAGLEMLQRWSPVVGPRLQWDLCTRGILQCKRQQRGCYPAFRGLLRLSLEGRERRQLHH